MRTPKWPRSEEEEDGGLGGPQEGQVQLGLENRERQKAVWHEEEHVKLK